MCDVDSSWQNQPSNLKSHDLGATGGIENSQKV